MILGTHNSASGSELVKWLKPFAWFIKPTSNCQSKTIIEQLNDGVRVFNLQIAYVNGKWRFTHGFAVYDEYFFNVLTILKEYATTDNPIYIQIYLDRCFWADNSIDKFRELISNIVAEYNDNTTILLCAWIEGTNEYPYKSNIQIPMEEKYWTFEWGKKFGNSIIDRIPLPKRHSKKYNDTYKKSCNSEYLMLDFYEL
jgi:hypothetical protein